MMHKLSRTSYLTLVFAVLLLYAFSSSHPVSGGGYTGGPGDGVCAQCHTGSNTALQGEVIVDGLPATLDAGDIVPITVRVTNPSINAVRAGFQLVALDDSDQAIGTISNVSANASVKTSNGREYVGHQPAQNFLGTAEVSWTFDYEVPANPSGVTDITFYAGAIIANGSGGNSGDRFVVTSETLPVTGVSLPLEISIVNTSDSPCADKDEGSATAAATGGMPPYDYLWENGISGPTNNVLAVGTTSVTVTDDLGDMASTMVTIGAPPLLELDVLVANPAPCDGQTGGSASVAATGGVGGYQYDWPGGLTGPDQTTLDVGNYVVTATDANLCESTVEVVIDAIDPMMISPVVADPTCWYNEDGSITLNRSGGTAPFQYVWNTGFTQENLIELAGATYTVTITDANNCTLEESFTLVQPDILVVETTVADATCTGFDNGSIDLSVTGGSPPYAYTWSNGETTEDLLDLDADTYAVTILDNNDCEFLAEYTVQEPFTLSADLINQVNVECYNDDNGLLDVAAFGGIPPYDLSWSDGGDGTGLAPGVYTVTIVDNNNCTTSATYTITSDNPEIVVAVSTTAASGPDAMDGSANAIVVGGTAPYSYTWSTGDTLSSFTGLNSGLYTLTVTDASQCSVVEEVQVGVGNCLLSVSPTVADNFCPGDSSGAITLTISNGQSPNITWSTGDTTSTLSGLIDGFYSVTVTNSDTCSVTVDSIEISSPDPLVVEIMALQTFECDGGEAILTYTASDTSRIGSITWSGGSPADTITVDSIGGITLTVTDIAGCTITDSIFLAGLDSIAPVFILPAQPSLYVNAMGEISIDTQSLFTEIIESCSVDSFNITIDVPSDTASCDLIDTGIPVSLFAQDGQGNSSDSSFLATLVDTIRPTITVPDTIRITSCDTVPAIVVDAFDNCQLAGTSKDLSLVGQIVALGYYPIQVSAVDVQDNVSNATVIVEVVAAFTTLTSVSDVSCFGENDGSYTVDGIAGYDGTFTVTAGNGTTQNLAAGSYSYAVTDSLGCTVMDSIFIGSPAPLMVDTVVINDSSDSTSNDGSIGTLVSGGTQPFSFEWRDTDNTILSTNSFIAAAPAGTYYFSFTDANGCTLQDTFVINADITSTTTESNVNAVALYPNPASNQVYISGSSSIYEVRLYNLKGQVVLRQKQSRSIIDISSLSSGLYIAEIRSNQTVHRQRIMISN